MSALSAARAQEISLKLPAEKEDRGRAMLEKRLFYTILILMVASFACYVFASKAREKRAGRPPAIIEATK